MATQRIAETEAILNSARSLTALQQKILFSLADRGPGLPLEVAVRILSFPEEVAQPVADLRTRGLISSSSVRGGPLGSEVLALSRRGEQVVAVLRQEAAQADAAVTPVAAPSPAAVNPRQQEVDLLRKLGDLAIESGEPDKAQQYYKDALDAARKL